MKCSIFFLAKLIAAKISGFWLNVPSLIALLINVNDSYLIRPAPKWIWPTSEFPICPSGNPTHSPAAWADTHGYFVFSISTFTICHCVTAFPFTSGAIPHPSITANKIGCFAFILLFLLFFFFLNNYIIIFYY